MWTVTRSVAAPSVRLTIWNTASPLPPGSGDHQRLGPTFDREVLAVQLHRQHDLLDAGRKQEIVAQVVLREGPLAGFGVYPHAQFVSVSRRQRVSGPDSRDAGLDPPIAGRRVSRGGVAIGGVVGRRGRQRRLLERTIDTADDVCDIDPPRAKDPPRSVQSRTVVLMASQADALGNRSRMKVRIACNSESEVGDANRTMPETLELASRRYGSPHFLELSRQVKRVFQQGTAQVIAGILGAPSDGYRPLQNRFVEPENPGPCLGQRLRHMELPVLPTRSRPWRAQPSSNTRSGL